MLLTLSVMSEWLPWNVTHSCDTTSLTEPVLDGMPVPRAHRTLWVQGFLGCLSRLHRPQAPKVVNLALREGAAGAHGEVHFCWGLVFQLAVHLHWPLGGLCASLGLSPATSGKLPCAGSSDWPLPSVSGDRAVLCGWNYYHGHEHNRWWSHLLSSGACLSNADLKFFC